MHFNGAKTDPGALLWAKAPTKTEVNVSSDNSSWHPLQCHMIDVAMVFLAIWRTLPASSRKWLSMTMGLSEEDSCKWLSFLAGLHDMGKATPSFQRKWDKAHSWLSDLGFDFPITASVTPHGTAGIPLIARLLEERGFETEYSLSLATCVAGHHGVFPTSDRWIDLGTLHLGGAPWGSVQRRLFWLLSDLMGVTALPLPRQIGLEENAFLLVTAGLTSVADWIASARDLFPYQGFVEPCKYIQDSKTRAAAALKRIGWTSLERRQTDFDRVFGFPPNSVQKAAMRVVDFLTEPALILIEAPMGQGKTEASLWLQNEMSVIQGLSGSYVALPTEATSNQMFGRVQDFLAKRYPEAQVNLHLVHGHASLSEDYRRLRPSSISDEDSGDSGSVVAEEWFLPKKRALLSTFAVGTLDQALLSVLRIKHGFVRLFALSGKVIIIDEVHAYDTYTSSLLDRLLSWLSAAHASVVLLSATLPRSRRMELLKAYSPQHPGLSEGPYPRIVWVSKTGAGSVSFPREWSTEVRLRKIENVISVAAQRLVEAIEDGGCAAWICNTVTKAQQAYLALNSTLGDQDDCRIILFHARFPYEERQELENEVLRAFSKKGCRPRRAILVATQVIEQSLDLDFDLMVTDIAPVDLLLQRCGRLHRHSTTQRPTEMVTPYLWLLEPDCIDGRIDFGGSSRVYEEYTLLRSWAAIRERKSLILPEDIDYLIQTVYDSDGFCGLTVNDSLVQQITHSRVFMEKRIDEQIREGESKLIRDPSHPSILEAFDIDLQEGDPTIHKAFQALTRQGVSLEVVCFYLTDSGPALKEDGTEPVDLSIEPDPLLTRRLLERSVRIGHRGLVSCLLRREVPAGWKRSAYLRHHRYLLLREGVEQVDGWRVTLDRQVGLTIEKGDDT